MMQGTMSLKYQKCCATQRTCPNGINSAETRTMLGAFLAWMAFVIEVPEVQKLNSFFWHVREICEQRLFASSRLSVRPYESTRLPGDDICTFVTISVHLWRYLYICDDICTFMTISVHLWRYLYIYDDICTFMTISVHLWRYLYICDDICTFMTTSRWILPRMRNISDKICTENKKKHYFIAFF